MAIKRFAKILMALRELARKPLQQASLVLEQESMKQEMLVMLLTSATSINM